MSGLLLDCFKFTYFFLQDLNKNVNFCLFGSSIWIFLTFIFLCPGFQGSIFFPHLHPRYSNEIGIMN